jgi:hypothetical protein
MLHSVEWKGQKVHNSDWLTVEDGTTRLSHNAGNYQSTPSNIPEEECLIYTMAETWNNACMEYDTPFIAFTSFVPS